MCSSLAIALSLADFPLKAAPRPFRARPVVTSARGALRPDEHLFLVTTTACDCGSPLLKSSRRWDVSPALRKQVRAHRARGWKEPRIERWLAEQRRLVEISGAAHPAGEGEHPSLADWKGLLKALLACGATRGVALVVLEDSEADGDLTCVAKERVTSQVSHLVERLPLKPDFLVDVSEE